MFAFMQDQNSFSLKLRSKKYTRFGKSLAGRNAGMVKSFPMATLLELNFIVYKLDLICSSSDLALAMQKCAYKWKVKYERKLNQGESKYLPVLSFRWLPEAEYTHSNPEFEAMYQFSLAKTLARTNRSELCG